MRVIAFSVWGSNDKFIEGALANIKLAERYYPGWRCRIYCGVDILMSRRSDLINAGFDVHIRGHFATGHEGLFWRFEPAYDPHVELFISRDCDSRINPREAAAVYEWLDSGKRLHTMRDHYEHIVPILGGMWGCRHWPEFGDLVKDWPRSGKMGDDQDFLAKKVWPLVKDNDCIQHDLYTHDTAVNTPRGTFTYKPGEFFGGNNLCSFPAHETLTAEHGAFVGDRVGL